MITVEPDENLVRRFGEQGGAGRPAYGQLAVCYDRDEKAARRRPGNDGAERCTVGGWTDAGWR